jgi:hypothetical protein
LELPLSTRVKVIFDDDDLEERWSGLTENQVGYLESFANCEIAREGSGKERGESLKSLWMLNMKSDGFQVCFGEEIFDCSKKARLLGKFENMIDSCRKAIRETELKKTSCDVPGAKNPDERMKILEL